MQRTTPIYWCTYALRNYANDAFEDEVQNSSRRWYNGKKISTNARNIMHFAVTCTVFVFVHSKSTVIGTLTGSWFKLEGQIILGSYHECISECVDLWNWNESGWEYRQVLRLLCEKLCITYKQEWYRFPCDTLYNTKYTVVFQFLIKPTFF